MSIRRISAVFTAFILAFAVSFSTASITAEACDPTSTTGGLC